MSVPNEHSDSLSIQERDLALLRGLFESRVMSAPHVAALYFDGKAQAAKKRTQKLKTAGLIGERPRQTFEPSILFLARKGLEVVRKHGVLAEYPPCDLPTLDRRTQVSDLSIRHELQVIDVKTAVHTTLKGTPAFSLAEFSTWPLLHQFKVHRPGYRGPEAPVKPDGFVRIRETMTETEKYEHTFFLELDRSTEAQETLLNKAASYLEYYKSGGFAVRNGVSRDDYKGFPFRVLMVFKTAERRNNTAERLLLGNPPILTMACLSTFDEVTTDPLGSIWICPRDYRDATKGTRFDVEREHGSWRYRRRPEREATVESQVEKFSFLARP